MIGIPGGIAIPGTPGAGSTLNPADKSAHITLSNGNLTGTGDGAGGNGDMVRGTTSKTTGKLYFEVTPTNAGGATGFGIANATEVVTGASELGFSNNSIGQYRNGDVRLNSSIIISGPGFVSGGAQAGIAVDIGGQLIWFRDTSAPTVWNAGGTANPATGVGGVSFAVITGAIFICLNINANQAVVATLNVGTTSFNASAPAGFSAWG